MNLIGPESTIQVLVKRLFVFLKLNVEQSTSVLPPSASALPGPAEERFNRASKGAKPGPPGISHTWRW